MVISEASICDNSIVEPLFGDDPTKSYGEYKKPYPWFYGFCYKIYISKYDVLN